ncbi:MAG: type II toxin-antitoxin system prevent-host-death family antitoxin [Deltaproteobacteria bacterium]|nr:type II toxin-antitoxin system prevent-host-death family antitoxin [Deltaproteobacteria bacterium]
MVTAGVRELKNRTSEFLRRTRTEGPVIITSHGRPIAAMIPLEPDEVEDFLLAHSPRIQAAVKRGTKDVESGRVHTVEELLREEGREA